MAMPSAWIDRIFEKLQLVYGSHFTGRWSGVSIEAVKADWAHELDGMEQHPDSIKHALQHLPIDQPPTVLQFRELCRKAPLPKHKELPAPPVNKAAADAALSKIAQVTSHAGDRLDPIRGLMRRELAGPGHGLTKFQRDFWRKALQREIWAQHQIDTSQPFDVATLKAAMQPSSSRAHAFPAESQA